VEKEMVEESVQRLRADLADYLVRRSKEVAAEAGQSIRDNDQIIGAVTAYCEVLVWLWERARG
jgi:hypothetical protein